MGATRTETIVGHVAAPEASEYAPHYDPYIKLVPAGDLMTMLADQPHETRALIMNLDGNYRYAPDKWSAKETLGHLIDVERVMSYRALRIARADRTPIEGFEQDDYVRTGNFDAAPLGALMDEFECVRHATLFLFGKLEPEAWLRRGIANSNEISVRALAYVIAGHELHHRRILDQKYRRS
jgi:DinB superfamily